MDLNYQELTFNYRSTKNIVRFCNGIQALRSVLFQIPNLKPQTTWQYENLSPMPVWFEKGKGDVLDALKRESDLTIIIPCHEGEEISFVDNDDFLAAAVQRDDTGVPQKVLSATRSKGLEFNRVVLYGFGEECPLGILAPIKDGNPYNDTPEKLLPNEYFINRLYVAASRPKRRLFVIDTVRGLERLWGFATDPETQEAVLDLLRHNKELWRENIGILQRGVLESWSSDREDLNEIAERYEREGLLNMDSYMLRSAALSYQNVGNRFKARQCRAYALFYEENFIKAGEAFTECEDFDQALSAYWEGSEYNAIVALGKVAPQICTRIEHRLADFFMSGSMLKAGLEIINLIETELSNTFFIEHILASKVWRTAIIDIFHRLLQNNESSTQSSTWRTIAEAAERISSLGLSIPQSSQGMLYYRAGNWSKALFYWEAAKETYTEEFNEARARLLITEINARRRTELTVEEARILADHYSKADQLLMAVEYWAKARDEKGLAKTAALALKEKDNVTVLKAIEEAVDLFIANGHWLKMLNLPNEGKWAIFNNDQKNSLQTFVQENADCILAGTVLRLAQSELLPNAETSHQKKVSDYLNEHFLRGSASWALHTTPDVAGAAIERAGRVIDALQFYENVMNGPDFTPEQKKRARMRWIKNKYRQAEREERDMKSQIAQRHIKEADDKSLEWGVSAVNTLPEYPQLKGLTETVAIVSESSATLSKTNTNYLLTNEKIQSLPDGQMRWLLGDLSFRYSKEAGRINVEHQRTLEMATIQISDLTCISGDVKFNRENPELAVFTCQKWQIQFDLSEIKTSVIIKLRFLESGLETIIPL